MEPNSDPLRYPIGKFIIPETVSDKEIAEYISVLEGFPARIRNAVANLNEQQLEMPYRPEGWTVRQVVHHCADSHMNCLIRFKLTLTEEQPVIKPYNEAGFAELADTKHFPIAASIQILEGVHARLSHLLRSMSATDFSKIYIHPQYGKEYRLDQALALYAWHCNHHLAHISLALNNSRNS